MSALCATSSSNIPKLCRKFLCVALPLSLSLSLFLSLSLSLYRHCRCTYSVPSVVNLHVVAIAISYCRCASQFFFGYSCNLLIPALCLAPSSAVTFNRVYLSHYVSIALCTYVLLFILLSVSLSLSILLACRIQAWEQMQVHIGRWIDGEREREKTKRDNEGTKTDREKGRQTERHTQIGNNSHLEAG